MKKYILAIVCVVLFGCLSDDTINNEFDTYKPISIDDGHIISTPAAENIDSLGLIDIYKDVYSDENLWSLRSLLVFKNGKLVAESYLKDDDDITNRHLIWSCTKQVMATLIGIAIDNGLINSLDDPISQYLDEELIDHSDKAKITIHDLITMHSGIDYNNDGANGQTDQLLRQLIDNSVDYILNRPFRSNLDDEFHYNDGDPHLLSAILEKISGEPTDEWADRVLFSKIGLDNYEWDRYKDGVTFGGFGIITTPRDLAKIALCVADNGKWKDEQIVSSEWINNMTSKQVEVNDDYSFGYYWWIDTSREIHFMWGHGGQFAFIYPPKNLVIVMTSIPNTQGDYQIQADEALKIVDKIIDISN